VPAPVLVLAHVVDPVVVFVAVAVVVVFVAVFVEAPPRGGLARLSAL